jgi:hypothetical protein
VRVGAEPLYRLTVLGTLGGTFSQGYAITASDSALAVRLRSIAPE